MFGSSGRVRILVGFDQLICWFFRFGLFWVRVENIVFKNQNFWAGSIQVYGSDQFLSGPIIAATIDIFLPVARFFFWGDQISYNPTVAPPLSKSLCLVLLKVYTIKLFFSQSVTKLYFFNLRQEITNYIIIQWQIEKNNTKIMILSEEK